MRDKATENINEVHGAGIASNPFGVRSFIEDVRYLWSDEASRRAKKISVRKHNVRFLRMFDVKTLRDLTYHRPISLVAFRNIKNGEECSLDYGSENTKIL